MKNRKFRLLNSLSVRIHFISVILVVCNQLSYSQVDEEWQVLDQRMECVITETAQYFTNDDDFYASRYNEFDSLALAWDADFTFNSNEYWFIGAVFRDSASADTWWKNKGLLDIEEDGHYYYNDSKYIDSAKTIFYWDYKKVQKVSTKYIYKQIKEYVTIKVRGFEVTGYLIEGTIWWKKGRFIVQVGKMSGTDHDKLINDGLLKTFEKILHNIESCQLYAPFAEEIGSFQFSEPIKQNYILCYSDLDLTVIVKSVTGKYMTIGDEIIDVIIYSGNDILEIYKSGASGGDLPIHLNHLDPQNNIRVEVKYGDIQLISNPFNILLGYKINVIDPPEYIDYNEEIQLNVRIKKLIDTIDYTSLNINFDCFGLGSFYMPTKEIDSTFTNFYTAPSEKEAGLLQGVSLKIYPFCAPSDEASENLFLKFRNPPDPQEMSGFYNTQTFGGEGSDAGQSVSFGDGVVYLAGDFNDYMSIDGEPIESHGDDDIFISKYNENDTLDWLIHLGGDGPDHLVKATGDSGKVDLILNTDSYTFNIGGKIDTMNGNNNTAFISYDGEGKVIYAALPKKLLKSTSSIYSRGLAVDNAGNTIVTGQYDTDILFESYVGDYSWIAANSGDEDMFVVSYDPHGDLLWGYSAGSPNRGESSEGNEVVTDENGNIYVAGEVDDFIDFGPFQLEDDGVFVLKLSPDGIPQWAKLFEGNIHVNAMAIDENNDIVVSGTFLNNIDYNGTVIEEIENNGEIYIAKINNSGELIWFKQFQTFEGEGHSDCDPQDIVCDKNNTIFIVGYFDGSIIFSEDYQFQAIGNRRDFFVLALDSEGNTSWALKGGGEENDYGRGIAVNNRGEVIVTGSFRESADFTGNSASSNGGSDIFFTYAAAPLTTSYQIPRDNMNIELFQNFPNPFTNITTILYALNQKSDIQINVYSISGTKVYSYTEKNQPPGKYHLDLNAADFKSGIYLYQLKTTGNTLTKKMIVK